MGAMPLDENGNWLYAGYVPQTINSGYGSITTEVKYFGDTPYTSQDIEVFMYFVSDTFYTEVFQYEKTWTPE